MRNDIHMIEECTTAHFDINITECVLYTHDNTCSPMLYVICTMQAI